MLKKMLILLIIGLIFSSCQLGAILTKKVTDGVDNKLNKISEDKKVRGQHKKDGPYAISKKEYKEEIKEAMRDIVKRPLNKEVKYAKVTLMLPENTKLNKNFFNIVDEKTGYGLPITFNTSIHTDSSVFYNKGNIIIMYNDDDELQEEIVQKIVKVNGFKKNK